MHFGTTHFSDLVSESNILFTCEHATGRIPAQLGTLGITPDDLKNCKDLYDPGALSLMRTLATHFNASHLYADLSRLVIDVNRHFDAPSKSANGFHASLVKTEILTERDGIEVKVPIPHNQHIPETEERALYDNICVPYQNELIRMVNELKQQHDHVFIISIHSFFPSYAGQVRTVDIDVMGYIPPDVAPLAAGAIRTSHPTYNTAIDQPWSAQSVDGGVFFILKNTPDITTLFFDIKNDNLTNDADIAQCAKAITSGIRAIVATPKGKGSD